MALQVGTRLGPYEILSALGSGGMGEVYRARDAKLQRDVALKILPEAMARDAQRMARFQREAQVLASLNHPNIAAIHGLEESNGVRALVMELVEGETLAERLVRIQPLTRPASRDTLSPQTGRGEKFRDLQPSPSGRGWSAGPGEGSPLAVDDALPIARQIAEALEYAHEHGVIHRDLKPANVKITSEGTVKVLDFGLAKVLEAQDSTATTVMADSPTLSGMATQAGMILGTAAYMSPEQARGQRVDRRADIWAFGCVLFEMLSGRKAFGGETISDVLAAVLTKEPDWNALPATTPLFVQKLIRRCLQKEVRQRLQAIGDARIEIEEALDSSRAMLLTRADLGQPRASDRHADESSSARATLQRRPSKTIDSLVVLPFVNESGDPDAEYLGEGIAETTINTLSAIRRLRVVPRASAFHFKGSEANHQAVANALKVRAVLTGRVLQRGENLIVSAELIDTATDSQLWGARYSRKMADIFEVQEEIAKEISERLRLQLTPEERKRLAKRPTQNREAYQLYLRGAFHWSKWTPEGMQKCLKYCRQALEIDPAYAPAHARISCAYGPMGVFGHMRPREAFVVAKAAALKALEIDERLAEGHFALGNLRLYFDWDWPGAEEEFRRAIEISPGYSDAHWALAVWLMVMCRYDEAVAEAQTAVQLDPLSFNAVFYLGTTLYESRRDAEAADQFRKALELNPAFDFAAQFLARALSAQGRHEEALSALAKVADSQPTLAYRALVHAYAGHREKALAIARELEHQPRLDIAGFVLLVVHGVLGQEDEAMKILGELFEERLGLLIFLNSRRYESLRGSPRFQDLLRRIGLPRVPGRE